MKNCFILKATKNTLVSVDDTLEFIADFLPLRPFQTRAELIIKKASGGRWRFELLLKAGEPPVDDVIRLEAAANQTSTVAFKLNNQFPVSSFPLQEPSYFLFFPSSTQTLPVVFFCCTFISFLAIFYILDILNVTLIFCFS